MTIILGIVLFFLLYRFVKLFGKSFPLFELVGVLYLLQYGITPMIDYEINPYNMMAISKEKYLWMSSMSCYAFILGLLTIKLKFNYSELIVLSFYLISNSIFITIIFVGLPEFVINYYTPTFFVVGAILIYYVYALFNFFEEVSLLRRILFIIIGIFIFFIMRFLIIPLLLAVLFPI